MSTSRLAFLAAGVAAAAAAFSLAVAAPASAASEPEPVGGGESSPSVSLRDVGLFKPDGDDPHLSGGDVSAHGWWKENHGPATHADVTVRLQIKRGNSWAYVGKTGKARVTVGGGRGKRATGRAKCKNTNNHQWRSIVDVDIVGYADPPDKKIVGPKTLECGV
ncbi:MAG TPA: hypothetical protein VHU91_11330 [Mycobacteriales bacterium]|jgi:hypothetical protein|nr:hypothetical protein [Mycobacteriales bacterium]